MEDIMKHRSKIYDLLREIKRNNDISSALDVGAGDGWLGTYLSSLSVSYSAVEVDDLCLQSLWEKGIVTVSLKDAVERNLDYDLIILGDVVELLPPDDLALIPHLLSPNGVLLTWSTDTGIYTLTGNL